MKSHELCFASLPGTGIELSTTSTLEIPLKQIYEEE
jgi:hypothetical protein